MFYVLAGCRRYARQVLLRFTDEPDVIRSTIGGDEEIRIQPACFGLITIIEVVRSGRPELARTIDEDFIDQIYVQRVSAIGLLSFSSLALFLAAAGVFGLTSYVVRRRTQEFGIRLALGARPTQIVTTVIWRAIRITTLGCLTGLVAAFALNRLLVSLLFQVSPADPWTFVFVSVLLTSVAICAAWLAARQASRLDPAREIRIE